MHTREYIVDAAWAALIVLLLPIAIPVAAVAFLYLLGQRLFVRFRRPEPGYAG